MTSDRETTSIVRSWITEGVDRLPDRVLDAVLDEVPATPQRRPGWPARRSPRMPSIVKLAASVAAVLVLLLVGYRMLPDQGGVLGPTVTPSPSSSAIGASPSPSATPVPTTPPLPSEIPMGTTESTLGAGTYRIPDPFRPLTFTLPSSWIVSTGQHDGIDLLRTEPADFAPRITVIRPGQVFVDPCHPAPPPSLGPIFVNAAMIGDQLRSVTGFTAGPVSDTTVGGHRAKTFVLTNAISFEVARTCEGSPLDLLEGTFGRLTTNQGSVDHIWVVEDVGTLATIVVDVQSTPGRTPDELVAEAEAIVASFQYEK